MFIKRILFLRLSIKRISVLIWFFIELIEPDLFRITIKRIGLIRIIIEDIFWLWINFLIFIGLFFIILFIFFELIWRKCSIRCPYFHIPKNNSRICIFLRLFMNDKIIHLVIVKFSFVLFKKSVWTLTHFQLIIIPSKYKSLLSDSDFVLMVNLQIRKFICLLII